MSTTDEDDCKRDLSRRSVLLAAASALGSTASIQSAQAQDKPAPVDGLMEDMRRVVDPLIPH
jgi:hypothetical protein